MADKADQASELTEYMQEKQIAAARAKGPVISFTGYCLNCGELTCESSGRRWCDASCRDDWEKLNSMGR